MGTWRHRNVTQAAYKTSNVLHGSVSINNRQPCDLATLNFSADANVADEGDEWLVEYAEDNSTFVTVFAGDISVKTTTQWETADVGGTPYYAYSARDFTARLDDTIITQDRNTTESIHDRAVWILSFGEDFGITTGGVEANATLVGPAATRGLSKRAALDQLAGPAQAVYYVDFDKEAQFRNYATVVAAPFDLVLPRDHGSDEWEYNAFSLDSDVTDQADAIYVMGEENAATWVSAPPTTGQKQRAISTSFSTTADLTAAGVAELIRIEDPQLHGTLTTWKPGLYSGMTVHITQPAHSIDADYIINGITVTPFPKGPGGTEYDAAFALEFSDRLLCIPAFDPTLTKPKPVDCTNCTRAVAILPSGIDQDLALAPRREGMFVFKWSTDLLWYSCDLSLAGQATTSVPDIRAIYHEPLYEAILAGDRAFYTGSVGTFGDDRWTINADVTAASTMDIRKAWVVNNTASSFFDSFTRTTTSPALGTTDTGETYAGPGGEADSSTAAVNNATIRSNATVLEYNDTGASPSAQKTIFEDDRPWEMGRASDLYVTDLNMTFSGAARDQLFQITFGDAYVIEAFRLERIGDGTFDFSVQSDTDADFANKTLTSGTNYSIHAQRVPAAVGGYMRARIWASSGAEPSSWDVEIVSGDESGYPSAGQMDYWFTGDMLATVDSISITGGVALERRDMVDGSLETSAPLLGAVYDVRATPNGQHLMLLEGTDNDGPVERYSRTPAIEDTYSLTNIYIDLADWNVDDAYNVYKMTTDGVLTRYSASSSSSVWSVDLQSLYSYYWPSRASYGSAYGYGGTVLVAGSQVYVCGYIGGANWQSGGSEACVLTLDRASGDLLNDRRFTATGGNEGAQAIAMSFAGACLWVAGAADGTDFEGQTISGVAGWIAKMSG